ncbi:MAG: endo-1,4-beta-xylanase [Spirochaetales bacterium]|nr:endo-1,4-beta-xylanase [Spirochaetales bacterium]
MLKKLFFLFGTVLLLLPGCLSVKPSPEETTESTPMKELGRRHNLIIGSTLQSQSLDIPGVKEILTSQYAGISAEDEMNFAFIREKEKEYNFGPADRLIAFAMDNDMLVRGQTLVRHNSVPSWLENKKWTKDSLLKILQEYITTVVSRYKGKVYCWDVVNEVLTDEGLFRGDELSIWYRYCGPAYIEKAFISAHNADPGAKLFINDDGISTINPKSNGLYIIVKELLARGIPIHGIGMQMHLTEEKVPDYRSMFENIQRFVKLGLEIHITEMDVRIKEPVTREKLMNQAKIYGYITQIALNINEVTNLTTNGFTDSLSRIPAFFESYGSALPFDGDLNPKPAFFAIRENLEKGPKGLKFLDTAGYSSIITPFKAMNTAVPPEIDGKIGNGEWDEALIYPFAYNQLSKTNQTLPGSDDLLSSWRVLYLDDTIYGLVERTDDITITNKDSSWENDNLEVFFNTDEDFVQLRSVAGQNFEQHEYTGNRRITWNAGGTVIEFSVQLPSGNPAGKITGWNIALSDNDGAETRDLQAYPIYGNNRGWQGLDFGEIEFVDPGRQAERLGKMHKVLPFNVIKSRTPPVIDGVAGTNEWTSATVYEFAFNQLNQTDQRPPAREDLYATWRLVYTDGMLYGMVTRTDDKTITHNTDPRANDVVEICFSRYGELMALRTLVGKGFESHNYGSLAKAVWSEDGQTLEFSLPMPEEKMKGLTASWSISITDTDNGDLPDHRLYPVTGSDQAFSGLELGEISFN